jgi:ABC-type antimicrobial peptide transport system permease subunit
MSIGERKSGIVTQRLLEVMAIYLLAFAIVIPIVLLTSPFMGAFFQNAAGLEDIENFALAMSAADVAGVFSAGIITLIVAITLSSLSVMRLHPKSILSRND